MKHINHKNHSADECIKGNGYSAKLSEERKKKNTL